MFCDNKVKQYLLIRKKIKEKRRELRNISDDMLDAYDIISTIKVNESNKMPEPKFGFKCKITNIYRHGSGIDLVRCPHYSEKQPCLRSNCSANMANNRYIMAKRAHECAKQEYEMLVEEKRMMLRKIFCYKR